MLGPKRRSPNKSVSVPCVFTFVRATSSPCTVAGPTKIIATFWITVYNAMHLEDVITHLIITCVISSGRRNYLANCLMASGYHERLIQLGRHASSTGKLTEMQVYDYFV